MVASGVAQVVTFQLKSHPTFVSDALEKDLIETVEHYAALPDDKFPNACAAGIRWQQYLRGMNSVMVYKLMFSSVWLTSS